MIQYCQAPFGSDLKLVFYDQNTDTKPINNANPQLMPQLVLTATVNGLVSNL
jgi:hypothetical protein